MRDFHVIELHVTDAAIAKFAKHDLSVDEVEEAVLWDPKRKAAWKSDSKHGGRLKVIGRCESSNKVIVALLDPWDVNNGVWKPRTAYRVSQL